MKAAPDRLAAGAALAGSYEEQKESMYVYCDYNFKPEEAVIQRDQRIIEAGSAQCSSTVDEQTDISVAVLQSAPNPVAREGLSCSATLRIVQNAPGFSCIKPICAQIARSSFSTYSQDCRLLYSHSYWYVCLQPSVVLQEWNTSRLDWWASDN